MILQPEVVEIDVLLAEYGALCYLRAMGKKTGAEVEDFRRTIVERIQTTINEKETK